MTWFKVDDHFYDHPKLENVSMSACGLWVRAGSYSARYRTCGVVPRAFLKRFGTAPQIRQLVKAGLWEDHPQGYRFVNWRKHQDGDYRPNISKKVRAEVMERDNYQCIECGSEENLSLDHIERYRDGGADTVENLRVMCMPCNIRRG